MRFLIAVLMSLLVVAPLHVHASVRAATTGEPYTRTTNLPDETDFTMMAWFRMAVDRNTFSTSLHRGAGFPGYLLVATDSDGTTLDYFDSDNQAGLTGTELVVGEWNHIAYTISGDTRTVYLNGVQDIQDTTGTPSITDTQITIFDNPGNEPWDGNVAAYKVWDAALTATEVLQELYHTRPVRFANLNTWLPFFNTDDDTADYSGNGFDMTETGTHDTEAGPPIGW